MRHDNHLAAMESSPEPARRVFGIGPILGVLACAALAVAGCGGGDDDDNDKDQLPQSVAPKVKFKGNDRLLEDMAQTLALDTDEVCNELGRYSCTHLVHTVALGGVAAYEQGLFEPLSQATVTSPMAADRLALSACITRADRDLAGLDPIIFKNLDIREDGTLGDPTSDAVTEAIDTLYKRAVQRRATSSEIASLRQLYRDIAAKNPDRAARQWAVLGCFSVMTTLEQLFY